MTKILPRFGIDLAEGVKYLPDSRIDEATIPTMHLTKPLTQPSNKTPITSNTKQTRTSPKIFTKPCSEAKHFYSIHLTKL